MTTSEIKALIESGIKGQGTNVDGGGALGTILEALTDASIAPVTVLITESDGMFYLAEGQDKNEIIAAYKAGVPMQVKWQNSFELEQIANIIGLDNAGSFYFYDTVNIQIAHFD